jgi:SAM-dependent methyltransferase
MRAAMSLAEDRPCSPACERNRDPILEVLRPRLVNCSHVLEIGSGTGQHAVHFAAAMPWLTWQCSDRPGALAGMAAWLDEAALPNVLRPLALDVAADWETALAPAMARLREAGHSGFDAAFSANTLHIMSWADVEAMFAGLGQVLEDDAVLVVYGPFTYAGRPTSPSNRDFDAMLRARDPRSGLRDAAQVDALARAIGLQLVDDVAMPANNRCLVWARGHHASS